MPAKNQNLWPGLVIWAWIAGFFSEDAERGERYALFVIALGLALKACEVVGSVIVWFFTPPPPEPEPYYYRNVIDHQPQQSLQLPAPVVVKPTREELAQKIHREWEEDLRIAELNPDEPTKNAAIKFADKRKRERLGRLGGAVD